MFNQASVEAAYRIGQFYLQKNDGDYDKTQQELYQLQISSVTVEDGVVTIHAARIGLLVGRRGENVDRLTHFLGQKVRLIEDFDSIYDHLIPRKS